LYNLAALVMPDAVPHGLLDMPRHTQESRLQINILRRKNRNGKKNENHGW
jgi:hypothetical protein